jgi:hypothetical protein
LAKLVGIFANQTSLVKEHFPDALLSLRPSDCDERCACSIFKLETLRLFALEEAWAFLNGLELV